MSDPISYGLDSGPLAIPLTGTLYLNEPRSGSTTGTAGSGTSHPNWAAKMRSSAVLPEPLTPVSTVSRGWKSMTTSPNWRQLRTVSVRNAVAMIPFHPAGDVLRMVPHTGFRRAAVPTSVPLNL